MNGLQLDRALGAALRVALENEQLRAAALAELSELEQARTRIVERSAAERRRLERDLHDGAQQRLVSLLLLLRMLAERASDRAADEPLTHAQALTASTLAELRRVARGIYPAVLADSGTGGCDNSPRSAQVGDYYGATLQLFGSVRGTRGGAWVGRSRSSHSVIIWLHPGARGER